MPRGWDAWYWAWLVRTLDEAGLAIVPKRDPAMAQRGKSARAKGC